MIPAWHLHLIINDCSAVGSLVGPEGVDTAVRVLDFLHVPLVLRDAIKGTDDEHEKDPRGMLLEHTADV
jgi:hypothetical protein